MVLVLLWMLGGCCGLDFVVMLDGCCGLDFVVYDEWLLWPGFCGV
jgi:hypothetical protein